MSLAQADARRADAAARLAYAYLDAVARGSHVQARGFASLLKEFWNANVGAIRQFASSQGATLQYPVPYINQASWADDNFVTAVIDSLGLYARVNGAFAGTMAVLNEAPAHEGQIPAWFGHLRRALSSTNIGNWADAIPRSGLSPQQLLVAIDAYAEGGELRLTRVIVGGGEIDPADPRRSRTPLPTWAWIAVGVGVVGALGVLGWGFYKKNWGRRLLGSGARRA